MLDFEPNWNSEPIGKHLLAGPLCSGEGSHDSTNNLYPGKSPVDSVAFTS